MREAVPEPAVANVLDYVAAWNEPDAATEVVPVPVEVEVAVPA